LPNAQHKTAFFYTFVNGRVTLFALPDVFSGGRIENNETPFSMDADYRYAAACGSGAWTG
jgi:hypothetical protein